MEKVFILLALLSIGLVALSGCTYEGTGTLVLQLTDAQSDLNISKANVTISSIEVHLIGSGWYPVVENPQTFDLIEVKNVKEFLGSVNLSAGHYSQIRLYIETALVTIDGIEHNLKVPSDKINLISPFQIKANETTTLTLDFDAQESIHAAGKDKYIIRPTIKIIQE